MSAHTPGPWAVYPETNGTEICAVDHVPGLPIRQLIARPAVGENWIANARLIAAALEMLATLKAMLDAPLNDLPWGHVRAAIMKAEGRL